jgi:hypothetical protein
VEEEDERPIAADRVVQPDAAVAREARLQALVERPQIGLGDRRRRRGRRRRGAEREQARPGARAAEEAATADAAQETSADSSCGSSETSAMTRSTRLGSSVPAPKCSVDSAPHATAKRRHSSGVEPL